MGVRLLNKFIKENCINAIKKKSLFQIKNKKIVIDASNLLYKLNVDNELIPMLYQTILLFKYYNIIPLFVFDGTPPDEKKSKLLERKKERIDASHKYTELLKEIEDNKLTIDNNIRCQLERLERTKTQLSIKLIYEVKYLLNACGIQYLDAVNEADELCAYLVNTGIAWACLSEDMDLIIYGCKRVMRYFSIQNHSFVLYDVDNIFTELNIEFDDFKAICVLCGDDYSECQLTFYEAWNLIVNNNSGISIKQLILTEFIKSEHIELYNKLLDNYCITNVGEKSEIDNNSFNIEYKSEKNDLKKFILEKYNFVFIK